MQANAEFVEGQRKQIKYIFNNLVSRFSGLLSEASYKVVKHVFDVLKCSWRSVERGEDVPGKLESIWNMLSSS